MSDPADGWLARLPLARDRPWIGLLAAVGMTAAGLLLRVAVDGVLPPAFPFVTFFPAIVASAFLFGWRSGLLAAVLGYAAARAFFIHSPGGTWFSPGMAMAMALYALVAGSILVAIHLMQRAYSELAGEREVSRRLAEDRELMMREVHHRVGNNLQLLASLLALQKRQVQEPEALRALDEASRRIGLVGRVQRQMHGADTGEVALGPFLDQLCRDLIDASGRDKLTQGVIDAAGCRLSSDAAIPIALIVAEAVSNAIEHAFEGEGEGRIEISVAPDGGDLEIRVEDNGRGLPPGFVMKDRSSLGLTIATLLARRLGGQFRLESPAGTRAILTFPRPA